MINLQNISQLLTHYPFKGYRGQGLSEYGLAGILITVVSVSGLMMLGGNLQQLWSNVFAFLNAKPQPAGTSAMAANTPAAAGGAAAQNSPGSMSFTTQNGSVITLPNFPSNASQLVETMGTNGATNSMVNALTAMAKQLLQSGSINQTQYNALINLSNAGHDIAGVEQVIEGAEASATSSQQFKNMTVNYNGASYTLDQLTMKIGFETESNDPTLLKNPMQTGNLLGLTQPFMAAYQAAVQSGVLSDPAVAQVINSMVSQINTLSQISNNTARQVLWQGLDVSATRKSEVSYTTNMDSAGICTTGGSTDTGVHCSS